MDCRVVVEAAVPVYDVETADEAVRIAISKTGKMINPDLNYVEIEVSDRVAPDGETDEPAFVVAGAAFVALNFEMDVFNVDREEHASRIAHTEIGDRLVDIPLEVLDVEELHEEEIDRETGDANPGTDDTDRGTDNADTSDGVEAEAATPAVSDTGADADASASNATSGSTDGDSDADDEAGDDETGDDVLPSFEELLEK